MWDVRVAAAVALLFSSAVLPREESGQLVCLYSYNIHEKLSFLAFTASSLHKTYNLCTSVYSTVSATSPELPKFAEMLLENDVAFITP